MSVSELVADRIFREGPLPFDVFMEMALYDPNGGFFSSGGGAPGRDFITSPEVGPLFGALFAHDLDMRWQSLETPDPFVVVDAGAGTGRLASSVMRAKPVCASAMRYVLVERSDSLRAKYAEFLSIEPPDLALGPTQMEDDVAVAISHVGPIVTELDELPAEVPCGVVFANELADNLPFRIVSRTGDGWDEWRVSSDNKFVRVPLDPETSQHCAALYGDLPIDTPVPWSTGLQRWLLDVGSCLRKGFVVLVDYAAPVHELAERGIDGWLRTYKGQQKGINPLVAPGSQDITADLCEEFVIGAARKAGLDHIGTLSQAMWLTTLGINEFVEEGEHRWNESAHLGDLAAIEAKSRGVEAARLTDASGLGAHRVFVFRTSNL